MNTKHNKNLLSTSNLIKISMLSAIAGVLMLFKFPISPIAPPFMTVDFGDVASLASGFILGPISGIITVIIKNIIHILLYGTQTFYVGELSNIIVGATFVGTASVFYKKNKTKKTVILGLIVGIIVMTVVATLSNYFIIFPMYGKLMGVKLQAFVDMMPPNNYIHSFLDLMLYSIVPFNIIKGALNSIVTVLIYKHISRLLKKI